MILRMNTTFCRVRDGDVWERSYRENMAMSDRKGLTTSPRLEDRLALPSGGVTFNREDHSSSMTGR